MAKAHHRTSRSKRKPKGTRKTRAREMALVVRPDVSLGPDGRGDDGPAPDDDE